MNHKIVLLAIALIAGFSCSRTEPSDLTRNSLIPAPEVVEATGDYFIFNERTRFVYPDENEKLGYAMNFLREHLAGELSGGSPIENIRFRRRFNSLEVVMDDSMKHSPEAYEISIGEKLLTIKSGTAEGAFRGCQTLVQLISIGDSCSIKMPAAIAIPTGVIKDHPALGYRGTMLDVARHFFEPKVVKQYIDLLALYKINHLHLHLSDDQGWRIEIKSWPKLTEIGGLTEVGGGEGGYFTQAEYTELVEYAASHYITIVPEIDMPGHTNAALASYPELNCDGEARELYTGTRVGFSTLCTDKEITYEFVEDVVSEISELTPGPYFHIGGDESHVTDLPDYIYFVNRVKKIVNGHDKIMVGWDEISHADLDSSDIAQFWASSKNAMRAAGKGASVILSPAAHCYLDMKYDSTTELGLDWAGLTELDKAYDWSPAKLLPDIDPAQIMGIESPLWGETIETFDDICYLAFPRLIGHAELGWSTINSLQKDEYLERLADHGKYLDKLGVRYYRSPLVQWK